VNKFKVVLKKLEKLEDELSLSFNDLNCYLASLRQLSSISFVDLSEIKAFGVDIFFSMNDSCYA
jgi:hypothetical protein